MEKLLRKKCLLSNFVINSILLSGIFIVGCNDTKKEKQQEPKKTDTVIRKNNTPTDSNNSQQTAATKPPILNMTDTISTKKIVLVIKDSAATEERISLKLAAIFGDKLQDAIKKNSLKVVGPPIAWYQSQKAPFFFEAGFPVDKKPTNISAPAKIKEIGIDSVVVVHFYGPYNLTAHAYEAASDWMKSNGKSPKATPYEIYVTDPMGADGKPIDPYKVQTDIVFPIKGDVKTGL